MKILRHFQDIPLHARCTAATIGNFDGVHRGHLEVLKLLKQTALKKRCSSLVITFEPYPKEFFIPHNPPARLTSFREKMILFKQAGIDLVLCLAFNHQLSNMEAEQFIENILLKSAHIPKLNHW